MILWLIACGFCFVAGQLHGQGKLFPWVRGAAGKARDAVLGSRPAASDQVIQDSKMIAEVSPTPPKNPIRAGQALKNILGFFVGLIGWAAKNPVAVLALAVLALWLVAGASCSGPFGKSRDALRLERELAEANTRIAQHEARLEGLAGELAVNTERDRTRRTRVIAQAQQEIEHAAAEVDPSALSDAYESRYLCVLDPSTCAGGADPAPGRSPSVRGARTDPA